MIMPASKAARQGSIPLVSYQKIGEKHPATPKVSCARYTRFIKIVRTCSLVKLRRRRQKSKEAPTRVLTGASLFEFGPLSLISQRLAGFQRVRDALLRFLLSAQGHERLAL